MSHLKYNRQRGSATLITLLGLVILTLVGIGALNSTRSETGVLGNTVIYRQNLARAEAAVRQGLAELKASKVLPHDPGAPSWLHNDLPSLDLNSDTNWGPNSEPVMDQECRFLAVYEGITYNDVDARGSGTQDHEYVIYGRSSQDDGVVIVQIGYVLTLTQ